ncbi:hypothetical protein HDV05_006916, partial [Chytridiales sp. JEL 0842]
INVSNFTQSSLSLSLKGSLPGNFFPLPLWVSTAPLSLKLITPAPTASPADSYENANQLMDLAIPEMSFQLNQDLQLDFPSFSASFPDPEALQRIVSSATAENGSLDLKVKIWGNLSIKVFGIWLWKDIYVERPLEFKGLSVEKLEGGLGGLMDGLPKFIKPKTINSVIKQQYPPARLITLFPTSSSFPLLALDALRISQTPSGPFLSLTVAFENPTVLQLGFSKVELPFQIAQQSFSQVSIENLTLKTGLNTLNLQISLDFLSTLPASDLQQLVKTALRTPASELRLGMGGPVQLFETATSAPPEFISTATRGLRIPLGLDSLSGSFGLDALSDLFTPSGIATLLSNLELSTLRLSSANGISVSDLGVQIPRFLALPPETIVDLPIQVSLGEPNGTQALGVQLLEGVKVLTNDTSMQALLPSLLLSPNSEPGAARVLASQVNPLLRARNATSSNLKMPRVSILSSSDSTTTPSEWSAALFGNSTDLPLELTLQPISVSGILSELTDPTSKGFLKLDIQNSKLSQRLASPGFELSTLIGFPAASNTTTTASGRKRISDGLPALDVDVSSVGLRVAMDGNEFTAVEIPSGLRVNTTIAGSASSLPLAVSLPFAENSEALQQALQRLVDSLLLSSSETSGGEGTVVGVSGIRLGDIQTFSEIVAELDSNALRPVVSNVLEGVASNLERGGTLLKVGGADFAMPSARSLQIRVGGEMWNPLNLEVDLGGVSLNTLLDGSAFLGVGLESVKLPGVQGPLELGVEGTIPQGPNVEVSEKLNVLLNDLLTNPSALRTTIGVENLWIAAHPGGSPSSAIPHFRALKINIPPSTLSSILISPNPASNPKIDLSPLLPSATAIQNSNPTLSRLLLRTLPIESLQLGLGIEWTNPAPLSASLPFLKIDLNLENTHLANVELSNLSLLRTRALLNPDMLIGFQTPDPSSASASLSKLAKSLLNGGAWDVPTRVKGLVLGGSQTDVTDLFSRVDVDVTPLLSLIRGSDLSVFLTKMLGGGSNLGELLERWKPVVRELGVGTLQGASMRLDAGVEWEVPFEVDVEMGYVSAGVAVGGERLVDVEIGSGLKLNSESASVGMDLRAFSNTDGTQSAVQGLCDSVFGSSSSATSLGVRGVRLGSSTTDLIQVLQGLDLDITLGGGTAGVDPTSLLSGLGIGIPRVGVKVKPQNRMGVEADLGLGGLRRFEVDIGTLGAGFGVGDVGVGLFDALQGIKVSGGRGVVGGDVVWGVGAGVQDTVAKLVDDVFAGSTNAIMQISKILLGASAQDPILTFQK